MTSWPKPTPFDIVSSLDKRRRDYRYAGWMYIMRNRACRDPLLKIGQSSRPPMLRALELSAATADPHAFEIIYFVTSLTGTRQGSTSTQHFARRAGACAPRR